MFRKPVAVNKDTIDVFVAQYGNDIASFYRSFYESKQQAYSRMVYASEAIAKDRIPNAKKIVCVRLPKATVNGDDLAKKGESTLTYLKQGQKVELVKPGLMQMINKKFAPKESTAPAASPMVMRA